LVVACVALLLFGAKRLPELGKGLGEGLKGFKEGLKGGNQACPVTWSVLRGLIQNERPVREHRPFVSLPVKRASLG
jgi:TatA/E family protein of Tat protein translocase